MSLAASSSVKPRFPVTQNDRIRFRSAASLAVSPSKGERPHITRYLEYVNADIGSPPDRGRARELSERLNLEIQIIDRTGLLAFAPQHQTQQQIAAAAIRRIAEIATGTGMGQQEEQQQQEERPKRVLLYHKHHRRTPPFVPSLFLHFLHVAFLHCKVIFENAC